MQLGKLPICEKRRLLDRVNEEIATELARQKRLKASLSADEWAVYRVAVGHVMLERFSRNTESDDVLSKAPNPELKALAEHVIQIIEQANNRFRELQNDGRIPEIIERLEGLGLLPVWLA